MSNDTLFLTPYKGLIPYSEEDAPFFFGRDKEREIITANLMASKLTLLYGESGVGKSSILRAGVAYHLNQLAQQNLARRRSPEFAVVMFPDPKKDVKRREQGGETWQDDPILGLTNSVKDAVTRALNVQVDESMDPSQPLAETLRAWTKRLGGNLLIILDQFEEYFLHHSQGIEKESFEIEFPRVVNHPELRANFLISIREDALAKLDRFKGRIPNLFGNYLRIDHLGHDAAHTAIVKPLEVYNQLYRQNGPQVGVEPELVEAVLEQTRIGQVILGETGVSNEDQSSQSTTAARIEAPYLQLVMDRLWHEEMKTSSVELRLDTLKRLGGAQQIVGKHLNEVMDKLSEGDSEIAARIFKSLVTRIGTKNVLAAADLDEDNIQIDEAARVLKKLAEARVLRPLSPSTRHFRVSTNQPDQWYYVRYEIFHDMLAQAILKWRDHYKQKKELSEANRKLMMERERIKRLNRTIAAIMSFILIIFLLGGIAYWQDWRGVRTKIKDSQARSIHLKLLEAGLEETVSDTALLSQYRDLLNTYPDYSDSGKVRATINRLEKSTKQFERLLAILQRAMQNDMPGDTLIIIHQRDSLKSFADSHRESPEKIRVNQEIQRLDSLINHFAWVEIDSFFTCEYVSLNKIPYRKSVNFSRQVPIYVWARVKAPQGAERVRLCWYERIKDGVRAHPKFYTIEKTMEGYRIYPSKIYESPGRHEVRLYNSQNILIGRQAFYVK
jgi:hypothetical protein